MTGRICFTQEAGDIKPCRRSVVRRARTETYPPRMGGLEVSNVPSDRLVPWTPFAIALVLIFSMMSTTEEWLYVAAVLGVLASIAVGRTLGRSDESVLATRVRKFARGWIVVVALAALSLLHGKWQPMAFFATAGVISSSLFWLGCKSSR
jgi:hypothetical protein